jgi:hypothetical protein
MNILTNPIIVALALGSLVYMYMLYTAKIVTKKSKSGKKHKIKQQPGFVVPVVIAVVAWLLTYMYHEQCNVNTSGNVMKVNDQYVLKRGSDSGSDVQRSFRMIKPGVNIPRGLREPMENLPDVFITAM